MKISNLINRRMSLFIGKVVLNRSVAFVDPNFPIMSLEGIIQFRNETTLNSNPQYEFKYKTNEGILLDISGNGFYDRVYLSQHDRVLVTDYEKLSRENEKKLMEKYPEFSKIFS